VVFDSGSVAYGVARGTGADAERGFIYIATMPVPMAAGRAGVKSASLACSRLLRDHDPELCSSLHTHSHSSAPTCGPLFPDDLCRTVPQSTGSRRTRSGSSRSGDARNREARYTSDLINPLQACMSDWSVRKPGANAEAYIRGETISDTSVLRDRSCFVEKDGAGRTLSYSLHALPFMANSSGGGAWPVDWLIPPRAIRSVLAACPADGDAVHRQFRLRGIYSGNPDFATRRLMQGFGLGLEPSIARVSPDIATGTTK